MFCTRQNVVFLFFELSEARYSVIAPSRARNFGVHGAGRPSSTRTAYPGIPASMRTHSLQRVAAPERRCSASTLPPRRLAAHVPAVSRAWSAGDFRRIHMLRSMIGIASRMESSPLTTLGRITSQGMSRDARSAEFS